MTKEEITEFQNAVWGYYRGFARRDLPWRQPEADGSFDPYKIMVSEIMLQQTPVPRVKPKFQAFLRMFPTVKALSEAPLGQVLLAWSGLGYNRRAKFLWQAAQMVQQNHDGLIPAEKQRLVQLPGIGANTAAAILVYAFNQPEVFIETNVRTVFIHYFFADKEKVTDAQLFELVQQTLPEENFREWYWALMDYGTHLKQTVGNLSRRSSTFTKQSKFDGSKRQLRGAVLRLLGASHRTKAQLVKQIVDERLESVMDDLVREGLIVRRNNTFTLP